MGIAQSRVLQDHRRQSRISVQMECRFKIDDNKEYGALILDLSQGGAFLSSTLLPVNESQTFEESIPHGESPRYDENFLSTENKISITLDRSEMKKPLTLTGTVKRSAVGMSEYGKVAQFGVEFENTPLEFLRLIGALSSRRKMPRISTKMLCRFRSNDKEYEATILDISKEGALFSSIFLPELRSKVFITLSVDGREEPLELTGKVTRNALSKQGEGGQFGVEFENAGHELTQFIDALTTA